MYKRQALATLISAGAAILVQLPGGVNWSFNQDIVAGDDPQARSEEVTVQGGIGRANYYPLDRYWDWRKPLTVKFSDGKTVSFYLAPADAYNAFLADNKLLLFPQFMGSYPTTVYIAYIAVNWREGDRCRWLRPFW